MWNALLNCTGECKIGTIGLLLRHSYQRIIYIEADCMKILVLVVMACAVYYFGSSAVIERSHLDQWVHVPGQAYIHTIDVLNNIGR